MLSRPARRGPETSGAVSTLPSSTSASENSKAQLRFRGFSKDTRRFLRSLEFDPCPSEWPGGERVAYLAHVLTPLKALVHDLQTLLADVKPKLGLEARVGASLHWTLGSRSVSGDCPVRRVRVWDAQVPANESPEFFAALSSEAIELGANSAGGDPEATARVREALLREGAAAREAVRLLSSGWEIGGEPYEGEAPADLPAALREWLRKRDLRISRTLRWENWFQEPGLAIEIAERFRELLPLFDVMRDATPSRQAPSGSVRSPSP
jgi:uncharacterized protein (DUF2461 family)